MIEFFNFNPKGFVMLVQELYKILNEISPFSLQESWDNSGLNLGSPLQSVKQIYSTLEVDMTLATNIPPHSLIITHHPLFFSSFKNFNPQNYPHNIASLLLQKHCALIAMHTNFDHSHLNPFFASKILGFQSLEKLQFTLFGSIVSQSFESLVQDIKTKLSLPTIKALKAQDEITQVFIVCGSGMSALPLIPPHTQTCLITGDIKHHDAMQALSLGISLIDVGHFESEIFFAQILSEALQNFGYEVIMSDLDNPLKFY